MKLVYFIALFCALNCDAQPFTQGDAALIEQTLLSFAPGPYLPLNDVTNLVLSGTYFAPLALYMPSSTYYTTNGNTVTLADMWTNHFNLTNTATTHGTWPVRQPAAINGYDTILNSVAAHTFLSSQTYTGATPHEIVMVMRWAGPTNLPQASMIFENYTGGSDSGRERAGSVAATGLLELMGNGDVSFDVNTNKWMVWDFVFLKSGNPGALMYTNNVLCTTSFHDSDGQNGLTLSQSYGRFGGYTAPCDVAFMVSYGVTNGIGYIPGTNSTSRSMVYSSLTNYFNLAP